MTGEVAARESSDVRVKFAKAATICSSSSIEKASAKQKKAIRMPVSDVRTSKYCGLNQICRHAKEAWLLEVTAHPNAEKTRIGARLAKA